MSAIGLNVDFFQSAIKTIAVVPDAFSKFRRSQSNGIQHSTLQNHSRRFKMRFVARREISGNRTQGVATMASEESAQQARADVALRRIGNPDREIAPDHELVRIWRRKSNFRVQSRRRCFTGIYWASDDMLGKFQREIS